MTPWLHEERIAAVLEIVRKAGARSVLDLGCGNGAFLKLLIQDNAIERVIGIDHAIDVLTDLQSALLEVPSHLRRKVVLEHRSIDDTESRFSGCDAVVLIETIEHIDPDRLTVVERAIFGRHRPATVIVTTPNSDFNAMLGVPAHRFRHPDHRFEWGRAKFQKWARGVARRNDYVVTFRDLGGAHPSCGGASQMAVFSRAE